MLYETAINFLYAVFSCKYLLNLLTQIEFAKLLMIFFRPKKKFCWIFIRYERSDLCFYFFWIGGIFLPFSKQGINKSVFLIYFIALPLYFGFISRKVTTTKTK